MIAAILVMLVGPVMAAILWQLNRGSRINKLGDVAFVAGSLLFLQLARLFTDHAWALADAATWAMVATCLMVGLAAKVTLENILATLLEYRRS